MSKRLSKLIVVDEAQYNRLRELGKMGMTFDDVVKDLLDFFEERNNRVRRC